MSQIDPKLAHAARPASASVVTPQVALTIVLATAARTVNLKTSVARSNAWRPLANLFTSQAPASPSRVFPAPMTTEVTGEPAVVTLTRNAPNRMAGQTR